MKENLQFAPLYNIDKEKLQNINTDELHWVLMRSLQNKVAVSSPSDNGTPVVERKYGYEAAQNLFCEFFMPMKESVSVIRGKRIIRREPAIAGMFFVRDSLSKIKSLSNGKLGFELKYLKGRKYQEPVVIDDKEMYIFIKALTAASKVRFFSPEDEDLTGKIGKRVRIYKGDNFFDGFIISFRGSKRRWLRIGIEGFLVAEMEIDLDALQASGQVIELLD